MSRPVQNDSYLEVTNLGVVNDQRIMNVWHYRFTVPGTTVVDGDALVDVLKQNIQAAVGDNLLVNLRAMCHPGVVWQKVRYQWIHPIRYSPTESAVGAGAGALDEDELPQNVAGVVTLNSIFGGPGSTGRKHFGGLTQSSVTNGMMTNSWNILATDVCIPMSNTIDTVAVQAASFLVPVIWDRATPANSIHWENFTLRDTARVMRRRTIGVGL